MDIKAISWFYNIHYENAKKLKLKLSEKTIKYVVHTYNNKHKFKRD